MKNFFPIIRTLLWVPLIIAALCASAQQKADLIIYNGKIATMAKPGEFKQAIAMQNGLILATGSTQTFLKTIKIRLQTGRCWWQNGYPRIER
jgi:hypothetical protein